MKSEDVSEHYRAVIGRRIYEERARQQMSQEALAQRVHVTREYLSRIENGNTFCSMDIYFRIAGALGVDPCLLMMESDKRVLMGEISELLASPNRYEAHVALEISRHTIALLRQAPQYKTNGL